MMRLRNPVLVCVLGLAAVVACTKNAREAAVPEPRVCVPGVSEPAGNRLAAATRVWALEAGGATSSIMQLVSAEDTIVALGAFANGLELQNQSLSGSGLFAAWIRPDGVVDRLDRLADVASTSSIEGALLTPDRLWIAIDFRDQLQILSADAPPGTLTAQGDAMAVVAFERGGALSSAVVAQGDFQRGATRLTSRQGGVVLTGTLGGLAGDGGVEILDGSGFTLTPSVGAFSPGHAVALYLSENAPTVGWMVDGNAGSTLQALGLTGPAGFVAGSFGGDASSHPESHFGPQGPTLASISADDDPAFDAYVGWADETGAQWAQRIRRYGSADLFASAVYEGDLVVSVTGAGGFGFQEGTPNEVQLGTQHAFARFDASGALRWATAAAPIGTLQVDTCGLWGVARDWSPWVAQPGEPDEIRVEIGPNDFPPLLQLDGCGRVLAARTIVNAPNLSTVVPRSPRSWLGFGTRSAAGGERFVLERIDW